MGFLSNTSRSQSSRRRFLMAGGAVAVSALAAPQTAAALSLLPRDLEVERGPDRLVYFPETGHHLSGDFLVLWGRMGGRMTLGPPISEPVFHATDEYQAFRNGILARPVEDPMLVIPSGQVRPLPLGETLAADNRESLDPMSGDRASSFWFSGSIFGVHPSFWQRFLDGGGAFVFGFPISNLVAEDGFQVQWFQRARFELRGEAVKFSPLGSVMAERLGIDIAPVPFTPGAVLFDGVANPIPNGPVSEREIEIDLTRQRLIAYQGDKRVYDVSVSTGRWATPTPEGVFPILRRVENEYMAGGVQGTDDYYSLSNVYFTQYFTWRGHAIHYAYWHDSFGQEMSHGCVNMTLRDAKWAWNFTGPDVHIRTHYTK